MNLKLRLDGKTSPSDDYAALLLYLRGRSNLKNPRVSNVILLELEETLRLLNTAVDALKF